MRQSLRKTLLWQAVGLLFYLAGMVLFLLVAVGAFLAPPANSLASLTSGDMVLILVSVSLLVVGRVIGWKFGGGAGTMTGSVGAIRGGGPDQSKLEELGYHVPPEETGEPDSDVVYEDGELYARCTECGAKNEQEFDYCSNCSSQLSE
jgi:hypothetical protein